MKPILLYILVSCFALSKCEAQVLYSLGFNTVNVFDLSTSKLSRLTNQSDGLSASIGSLNYDALNRQILLWKSRLAYYDPDTLITYDIATKTVTKDTTSHLLEMQLIEYDGHDTLYGIPNHDGIGYYVRSTKQAGIILPFYIRGFHSSTFDRINKRYFFITTPSTPGSNSDSLTICDLVNKTVSYYSIPYGSFTNIEYSEKDNKLYGIGNSGFTSFDLNIYQMSSNPPPFYSGQAGYFNFYGNTFDNKNNRYIIEQTRKGNDNIDTFFIYDIDNNILTQKYNSGEWTYHPLFSNEAFTHTSGKGLIHTSRIEFYPNPANEYIIITTTTKALVNIFDPLGHTVLSIAIDKGSNEIGIAHLSPGNYIISVVSDSEISTKKMTKN